MTVTLQFTVHGQASGYYSQGARPNWTRKTQYVEWKKLVQGVASAYTVLPLVATEVAPVRITTVAWFKNRVHPDTENIHKGCVDALFYGSKGNGDKYTAGAFSWPQYDPDDPRVEVTIERL